MLRCVPVVVVVIGSFAAPAGSRAAQPVSAEAAAWLDRAVAEFPAARKEEELVKGTPTKLDIFASERMLALMVFECRGSEADRARLLEFARRREKAPPLDNTPLERFKPLNDAAGLYALPGAKEEARRLLPEIDRIGAEIKSFEAAMIPLSRLMIRRKLGDLSDDDLKELGSNGLMMLAMAAAEDGRDDEVARYAALAAKASPAAPGESAADRGSIAVELALCGQIAPRTKRRRRFPRRAIAAHPRSPGSPASATRPAIRPGRSRTCA